MLSGRRDSSLSTFCFNVYTYLNEFCVYLDLYHLTSDQEKETTFKDQSFATASEIQTGQYQMLCIQIGILYFYVYTLMCFNSYQHCHALCTYVAQAI